MEVVPSVHSIPTETSAFASMAPPNVYLVVGRDQTVFIDSGYRKEEDIQKRLDYLTGVGGPPVSRVILTHRHPDHMGGAAHFHGATGAGLLSSPTEKPFIDAALEKAGDGLQVHQTVEDGEALELGGVTLEFVHVPGHTLGSMAIYTPQSQVLFTGDTILGWGSVSVNPDDGDMALYIQSLRRLMELDLALICPGHGPVVREPQAKLQEQVTHRLRREADVVEALREGHQTMDQLFDRLYPEILPQLARLGRNQVRSHLIKLEREGRVRLEEERYLVAD